jgi:uncharacterized phage-associated protein
MQKRFYFIFCTFLLVAKTNQIANNKIKTKSIGPIDSRLYFAISSSLNYCETILYKFMYSSVLNKHCQESYIHINYID